MQHGGGAIRADGEACRRDAGLFVGQNGGHVLRLHLDGLVGSRRAGVEQLSRPLGMLDECLRPEKRREEGHGAFEVAGAQNERPALVARRHVFACGDALLICERQRQIAVAEKLAAGALLEVQAIERHQQPRAELRHAILPAWLFPGARAVAGTVRDHREVRPHAAHDELRRDRRKMRVTPPAEAALDVRVAFLLRLLRLRPLRMHPRAAKPRLKPMPRIRAHQRPSRRIQRKAPIELLRHFFRRGEEITGHLAFDDLSRPQKRWQGDEGEEGKERFHAPELGTDSPAVLSQMDAGRVKSRTRTALPRVRGISRESIGRLKAFPLPTWGARIWLLEGRQTWAGRFR
jgi:hypothetical protein